MIRFTEDISIPTPNGGGGDDPASARLSTSIIGRPLEWAFSTG